MCLKSLKAAQFPPPARYLHLAAHLMLLNVCYHIKEEAGGYQTCEVHSLSQEAPPSPPAPLLVRVPYSVLSILVFD